ncbi:MAG: phosphoribosylformylglycinamidine cyclo-ligase [Bdellovibrionales bacterium]|nr:phosphoribosylformylglycinamidine cyclo-ligase [Bdellovibrionales bacterium]
MEKLTYQKAGVNPEKAAELLQGFGARLRQSNQDPRVLSGVGPFAACFDIKADVAPLNSPVLVSSCDGVGTKAMLALQWGVLDGLGQDLVAMNVNDLLCVGAPPLIFLDYYATSHLMEDQMMTLLESIRRACDLAQCSLVGGETAEMPGLYKEKEFDLAGFCVGIADRKKLLGPDRVQDGDLLLAIESSGVHSNGYSLIRKLVEQEKLDPKAPTGFSEGNWAETLLAPTNIYVAALKDILPEFNALAHITGGGLYENLPRALPKGFAAQVDKDEWVLPPLFQWIQEKAGLETKEMLSTFNCGVGMIGICKPENAEKLMSHVQSKGLRCWPIGRVAPLQNETVEWL